MNPLSKRGMLGLLTGAVLSRKQVPALLNEALARQLIGEPGQHPNCSRPDYPEEYKPLSEVLEVAEKLLFSQRQAEAAEALRQFNAYQWKANFLHSNSLSFRRARLTQLQKVYDDKSSTVAKVAQGFLEKYRGRHYDLGRDGSCNQAQVRRY